MKISKYIGETTTYDKKLMLERKDPISWLKSVSAFANTTGGALIFGVDDEGELVGLADSKKDSEDLSEAIKCDMYPVPEFELELPNLNYGVDIEDFQMATTTKTITKTTTKTITKEDATITKDDWAVLQIIRENPTVTAEEIGGKLGLTRAGAIYHINKLKTIEKICRVGTPRTGHWEVI